MPVQRQTRIPYQPASRSNERVTSVRSVQNRGARRRENFTVHKALVIISDPEETSVPTYRARADLRLQGLVIDDFVFDKRWEEDELRLNVTEQLPISLSTRHVMFVKASYGTLTPINLPQGSSLTCECLLRITGQGAVYVQLRPSNNHSSNATSTITQPEEMLGTQPTRESLPTQSDDESSRPSTSRQASLPTQSEDESSRPSTSHQASYFSVTDVEDSTGMSSVEDPEEIFAKIRVMFADKPVDLLRQYAYDSENSEQAIEKILDTQDVTLKSILEDLTKRVDSDSSTNITISRERIWRDCLSFYKVSFVDKFRLFRELKVEFLGEDGVDCGALKLEFFQVSLEAAKKSLLEAAEDCMIPKKTSASHLAYKVLGALIGHSVLQSGPGICCFPEWCYHYLCTGDFQSTAELLFSENQVPLNAGTALLHTLIDEIRKADTEEKLDLLLDETTSTGQVNAQIVNSSSWDITEIITVDKRSGLISELIIDELLRKRITQLNAIRDGLEVVGVQRHLRLYPELMKELFVTGQNVSKAAFMSSLELKDVSLSTIQQQVYDWFIMFIDSSPQEQLVKLLQFATSLKNLPPTGVSSKIEVSFHSSYEKVFPEAAVCFSQLFLPICHKSFSEFSCFMTQAISLGCEGFGLM